MTDSAPQFLTALAQALATMALYGEAHPARRRAIDAAYERLVRLQEGDPAPQFSFLGHEVVYAGRELRELRDWAPGARLAAAGVQRIEFAGPATREEFDEFLDEIAARLAAVAVSSAEARPERQTRIRYGSLGVKGSPGEEAAVPPPADATATATIQFGVSDEVEAIRWIHQEVESRGDLPLLEAEATVRSLSVAMHGEHQIVIPLLELKEFDQYTTTHSLNVAVLTMALAEYLHFGRRDVRLFGVAGLLHDLGKVRIPREILTKPGRLTDEERAVMQRHPSDGARMLLTYGQKMDIAATVAYEHHIMIDGGGYPGLHYPRDCHAASKLVHVCDVYDALRTKRPYRDAWESERVLAYLDERAGTEFDAALVRSFVAMMRDWDQRVVATTAGEDARWK